MDPKHYEPKAVEKHWQEQWQKANLFAAKPLEGEASDKDFHLVEMLPYPSGKLHMGHVRVYSIGDVIARFKRMTGHRVNHPMGWDAFGLPAENAAIDEGVHPAKRTRDNIDAVRTQMDYMGWSFDWESEIASCEPEYYRWNQWLFLRMLEKGLAYRAERNLNWCDRCDTVLANEQVEDGRCWRCDSEVVQKSMEQWFLRITDYAQELHDCLSDGQMDQWPERIRAMQLNWIGRSQGTDVTFQVEGGGQVDIFTTRVDTIYGCTYLCLAPEHPLVAELTGRGDRADEVMDFVERMKQSSTRERSLTGEKEGVFTGCYAINPYNNEKVPIWVANFVLMDYGTGAVMSVPGHDERDHAFAEKYGLPIIPVVGAEDGSDVELPYTDYGLATVCGEATGKPSAEAKAMLTEQAEQEGFGKGVITFRIKDWGISRQRYWGTPIPIIYCEDCGAVPVPDADLPVVLPEDIAFKGLSGNPLTHSKSFMTAPCPGCGKEGRRETDTMDTFVDSAWYYFRYLDPNNTELPFSKAAADRWFPIDIYIGGPEHAVMHLIYTRFWTKVMADLGLLEPREPAKMLITQGMVVNHSYKCEEHGYRFHHEVEHKGDEALCGQCKKPLVQRLEKMGKSKKNGVSPDDIRDKYGADTMRLFSLFAAPPEKDLEWSDSGVDGCYRFLNRLYKLVQGQMDIIKAAPAEAPGDFSKAAKALRTKTHQTIEKVTHEIGERLHLNTAVAAMMELSNTISSFLKDAGDSDGDKFALAESVNAVLKMLSPYAPHLCQQLYSDLGHEGFVETAGWPSFDPALCKEDQITYPVQVNGKMRGHVEVARDAGKDAVLLAAKDEGNVAKHLEGKTVVKEIFVPGRMVNLVVK